MEILQDESELLTCPYDNSHRIRRSRMTTHLVKCKKANKDTKLVECDFNCNHKIPEPELKYHHDNCPDKKNFEVACYQEAGQNLNKYPIVRLNIECDESWDDCDAPSYNPQKYCEDKPILRALNVASSAERKNFRIKERKRFAELEAEAAAKSQSEAARKQQVKPAVRHCDAILKEDVPASVSDLVETIKLHAKHHFIPRVNPRPE